MSLALGSIVLFLVLLPGIIFRSSYLSSSFSRRIIDRNPIDDVFFAILPAVFFHASAILIVNSTKQGVCGVNVDFDFLIRLSSSSELTDFSAVSNFAHQIFFYNSIVLFAAFLLGHLCRKVVRGCKWDRTFRIFRFTNKWHYIFSGEILDFPNIPDQSSDVDLILLDILSNVSGVSILYTGKYVDHSLTKDGDLDNIILKYPQKKEFGSGDSFTEISSKYLLIPFSTINNLNLRYFSIEETSEENAIKYEKQKEDLGRETQGIGYSGIEDAEIVDL